MFGQVGVRFGVVWARGCGGEAEVEGFGGVRVEGSRFADDSVALFPGGIGIGVIECVVKASAFGALQGGLDDDFGDCGQVAEFEQIGGDDEVPVVFLNFLLQVGQALLSAKQAFGGADDADIVPHAAADFVPVVGDDDEFVGVGCVAGLPLRDVKVDGWQIAVASLEGGAVGTDDGFQEGIAGETVCAVESGASYFSDGVEAGQLCEAIDGGDDAAALVMGCWDDRDGFFGDVNSVTETGFVDVRESAHDEGGRFVGDIEQDVVGAGAFHDAVDGASDDVAWGE